MKASIRDNLISLHEAARYQEAHAIYATEVKEEQDKAWHRECVENYSKRLDHIWSELEREINDLEERAR